MSQPNRRLFKVEPFRFKVQMDPQYPEKTWKFLESAIHQIYNHNAGGLSFEELYRNAYNMVMHKHGDKLYSGLVSTMTGHLKEISSIIESAQGTLFLEEMNVKWTEHNKSLQMIRDILMYMDRTYVVQSNKTPVHELGLNLWRDHVIRSSKIQHRLIDTLLDMVERERSGDVIDRNLMRNIVKMFVDLGNDVYVDDFEKSFLSSASEFYAMESQKLMTNSNCSDYLKKTERRLNEEMDRVNHYLDKRSEVKITTVVDKEMIGNHMKILVEMENSGMVYMLVNDKYEDMGRMYTLFKRTTAGLQILRDVLSSHLKELGKEIVTDPEKSKDPLEFVQQLLDMKDKYDRIIIQSFSNDRLFQNSLNASFEYFLNLCPRSPEFISLFIDDKLKKGAKGVSEEDIELLLDKVMVLFRFLQEKDVFEKYYKQHLAKRLLSGRTVSDDIERSFIVKLKTECGYQFTSKLEGMFTDMKTSKDTMQEFHSANCGDSNDSGDSNDFPALSVQVLTTGSWPIHPGARCNLPNEVLGICDRFRQHYLSTHTGRRLTWQPNMGTADLKLNLESRKYELTVSTYQMCVLMLFNNANCLTYQEIEIATDIPSPDLIRNLQSLSLIKGRNVLKKEPPTKEVNEDDTFTFNESFYSKLYKVKIGTVAAQKETEPEKQETRQKVEEDRKPQIEAAIVRIMKSRRVLDHNNLISEVTKQLQARFLPNPSVIKKRIESLIEREFLERDKNDRRLYRYLA